MEKTEYKGYTIWAVDSSLDGRVSYYVFNPQDKQVESAVQTMELARRYVDEDILHHQRRYIVTTGGGMFVGLFDYGRTYKAAERLCVLDCDLKTARSLAEGFGGRVYLLDYNKHSATPWSLLADCGQFWQQTGGNYLYRGRCINQLKAA